MVFVVLPVGEVQLGEGLAGEGVLLLTKVDQHDPPVNTLLDTGREQDCCLVSLSLSLSLTTKSQYHDVCLLLIEEKL